MANTLRFKRGLASGIPTALAGEPLFTTDTFDLYIGNGTTNTRFQKYIASGTTSQLLRGDGSLLTMPIVLTSPSNGQVLKFNGTNWVNDSDAGITGSGAAGQVAYFTGATTQAGSNNLFWDTTNFRLGIKTNSTSYGLDLGSTSGTVDASDVGLRIRRSGVPTNWSLIDNVSGALNIRQYDNSSPIIRFFRSTDGSTFTENARFHATGNFGIGTTTDSGQRLQVVGTGYFSDSVGIGTGSLTGLSLRIGRNISGASNSFGVWQDGSVQSTVSLAIGIYNSARTQATAFTLGSYYHFVADQFGLGAGSSITNQFGYFVDASLNGATNNYAFYSNIGAATGRWNLYMNGTANNYMAGNLGVGDTLTLAAWTKAIYLGNNGTNKVVAGYLASSTNGAAIGSMGSALSGWSPLNIIGSTLLFHTNGEGVKMTLDASGNLGLGVTPSAWGSDYKALQVNAQSSLVGFNGNFTFIGTNWYIDSGGTGRYIANGTAAVYRQSSGAFAWFQAASGTAGNAITFTQAMTLDASGNLAVGIATASSRLHVDAAAGVAHIRVSEAGTTRGFVGGANGIVTGRNGYFMVRGEAGLVLSGNGNSNDIIINPTTANVQISGTSDTGEKLQVTGTAKITGASTFGGNIAVTGRGRFTGTGYNSINSAEVQLNNTTATTGRNFALNSADSGFFQIYDVTASNTTRFLIDASGNVGIGTITPSEKLHVVGNGLFTGNLTVDTNTLFVDATNNRVGIGTATPDATLRVAGTVNGTQAIFGNVDGRGLLVATSQIAGTNDAGTILNARGASSGTFIFQTDGTQRVQIDSTGLIINGGNALEFINSAANAVSAIRPTGGGTSVMSTNSNGLHIAVGTEAAGDLILASNNTERIRLSSNGWFSHTSATNPSSSVTDSYVQYSADVTAGNAAPHFRTENGAVIKLYQETTAVGNSIFSQGGGNAVLDDSTFSGYTIRQVVQALRNQGILQ
jgi:hypothetical protein